MDRDNKLKRRPIVFLSHCSCDNGLLVGLADYLIQAGFSLWIDKLEDFDFSDEHHQFVNCIGAHEEWPGGIRGGIRAADIVLVCWSNAAIENVKQKDVFWLEIAYATMTEKIVSCQITDIQGLEECKAVQPFRGPQWARIEKCLADLKGVELDRLIADLWKKVEKGGSSDTRERISYDRNVKPTIPERFTARDGELERIHQHMLHPPSNGRFPSLVAVSGMPGLGKTSIAAAYVEQFGHAYDGVLWFGAERRAELQQGIAALGRSLCPPVEVTESGEGDDSLARKTLARLDGSGDAILYVFDNVENPREIDGLLPRSPNARILLTSRFPDWAHRGLQIELGLFKVEEARDFLLSGREGPVDLAGATSVAKTLGGLPLALSHARAFCRTMSFEQFLKRYREYFDGDAPDWDTAEQRSVFASVQVVLDVAAAKCGQAVDLLASLAFCAPDHIPEAIYVDLVDESHVAVRALSAASLVTLTSDRCGVTIHRLVQDAARALAERKGGAATAFARMARRLAEHHPARVTAKNWPECALLTPHLLSLIDHIRDDWLEEVGDALLLDRLAKLIVLAILYAPAGGETNQDALVAPESFVRALGMFYEIEPLAGALVRLIEARSAQWPELRQQFLAQNNYVLRHALAQALGGTILRGKMEIQRATELLDKDRSLEEFEVGGYALGLVYATNPELIDPELLTALAEHPCYPGRSILGDLMLNLVFDERQPALPEFRSSDRFWGSYWDFIVLDADAARAAQAFFAGTSGSGSFGAESSIGKDLGFFAKIKGWREELIGRNPPPAILKLLQDYRQLGCRPDCIRDAESELAETEDLVELMRLFFGHPQWSVSEAAATVLARIIGLRLKEADSAAEMITNLFGSADWRIRFGAAEASYALHQDDDGQSFELAVRQLHDDANCKIRGLCAENLGAIILSASPERREVLLTKYDKEIAFWLGDEDCWVLEHVHRLFGRLHGSGSPAVAALLGRPASRLFADLKGWPTLGRAVFLRGIEKQKKALNS